jgi:hypothetical protein
MAAQPDSTAKTSSFVIASPVEVPGIVLQPGSYVIRLKGPTPTNSPPGSKLLEIVSSDESRVYASITSIQEYRPPLPDKPLFSFYESADGRRRAIKAWWPTPDPYPYEERFIYPTEQALDLMAATKDSVLYLRPDLFKSGVSSSAVLPATPPPVPATLPPMSGRHLTGSLPKTASNLPLLLLAGLLWSCAGLAIRMLSISLAQTDRHCLASAAASEACLTQESWYVPARRGIVSLLSGERIRLHVVYRTVRLQGQDRKETHDE